MDTATTILLETRVRPESPQNTLLLPTCTLLSLPTTTFSLQDNFELYASNRLQT